MEAKELMVGDLLRSKSDPNLILRFDNWTTTRNFEPLLYCCPVKNKLRYIPPLFEDEVDPILLTKEILEVNGFYWGYTSSTEDYFGCISDDMPLALPNKTWCYDEGDGEVTVEFPDESNGGEITATYNDRRVDMAFCEPIKVHELQQFLRLCGGGLTKLANNFKIE